MNDYTRLIKNLVATALIVAGVSLAYIYFSSSENNKAVIDDTPIKIETIRNIAEISSVSYKDEVVIDSIEFHDAHTTLENILDWPQLIDQTLNDNIRRRLTLIVRGEVKYGIDLTKRSYSVKIDIDTLWLILPEAQVLDIILSPSQTEIFHEQGKWSDGERKQMEETAREKLRKNAEKLDLKSKAEENIIQLFSKLIRTNKKLQIIFEEN